MEFKRLSTLDGQSLLLEMGIKEFPKYVTRSHRRKTEPFNMCLWLLSHRFKCEHTKPLNTVQFQSLPILVDRLAQFKFQFVLSEEITNSMFHHVIRVWRNMIIDFEQKSMYPLTINNLDYLCGPNSSFVKVNE